MVVHPDDAWQHALAGCINHRKARRHRIAARLDRGDSAVIDQQGAVLDRWRTGAVNQPHVGQRDARTADFYKWLHGIAGCRWRW